MSKKIKNITLLKFLGKGAYGTVYLSTKDGKPGYFATKQIERSMADKPSFYKYFENELRLFRKFIYSIINRRYPRRNIISILTHKNKCSFRSN